MNREEAKTILLLYRPGTADAADPEIAEALALARQDPELEAWLQNQVALQKIIREKFRQITPPAGLQEQIIAALPAQQKVVLLPRYFALAAAAVIVAFIALATVWTQSHRTTINTYALYQGQMISLAQRAYSMDLVTSEPAKIHDYLAQTHAPDFALPAGMQNVPVTGCAVENWRGAKVSMVCFNTGKHKLGAGQSSDLWLFVVDSTAVPDTGATPLPQIAKNNELITADWTQDGKLYLIATSGDENTIKKFL
jgi:hypothetical protein